MAVVKAQRFHELPGGRIMSTDTDIVIVSVNIEALAISDAANVLAAVMAGLNAAYPPYVVGDT